MDAMQRLVELDAVARLRSHDATLFGESAEDLDLTCMSLGWTDLAERGHTLMPEIHRLAESAAAENVTDIVLLGMGGSSLASLVLASVLGDTARAKVHVLDTTAPRTVDAAIAVLDPASTLYVVASKSGGTIEPNALYAVFRDVADSCLGREAGGKRFIAITDPGSSLEALAGSDGFRALVSSPQTVGGRFSAMSVFGLVPAALSGLNVDLLLDRARMMESACSASPAENPAALLAAFIFDSASAGRDKLTIVASPHLASFGLWVEQLVAESLGKEGRGIVPVVELSHEMPRGYGTDRCVAIVRLKTDPLRAEWAEALASSMPVIDLELRDGYDVASEWTRWEHAVALLGPLLGVNPFGQPNVQAAKDATTAALAGELDTQTPQFETASGTALTFAGSLARPEHPDTDVEYAVGHALAALRPHDYLAVLAYLPDDGLLLAPLVEAVPKVAEALSAAVTLELGPRYLHSTGQLHKGGPNTGVFLLVTTRDHADAPVPGKPWCLRTLHRAQAEGDLSTLSSAGRRVLHVDLPDATSDSVTGFARALMSAAGVVWEA